MVDCKEMKDTLLVIHSYRGANEMVKLLWPYYKVSGCDMLGVGRTNAKCEWPEPICNVDIGEDPFRPWCEHKSDNLPRRLIDTLDVCLKQYPQYSDYCIIEWDSIFVKPLPIHTGGLVSVPCGIDNAWKQQGFKTDIAFLGPWWFDHETAEKCIPVARELIYHGDIEQGTPDFFIGLVALKAKVKYSSIPVCFYNTVDHPRFIADARNHYKSKDIYYIHGIKTPEQLKQITQ